MKLTTGILAIAITVTAGAAFSSQAWAQNPDAIDNARSVAKALQQKQNNDTNTALDAAGVPATAKPAPGAPAPAVKPAVIPAAKPAAKAPAASAASAATAKPAAASAHNHLQHVSVVQESDKVEIEISATEPVTPRVSKLASPARVLVELPGTVVATAQNQIPVNSAGVKGVRIGMDGKTPPTTSVVVDLEKACAYELTGSGDKLVLTLHTQGGVPVVAKSSAAKATAAQPQMVAKNTGPSQPTAVKTPAAQPQTAKATAPAVKAPAKAAAKAAAKVAAKPAPQHAKDAKAAVVAKTDSKQSAAKQDTAKETKAAAPASSAPEAESAKNAEAAKPKPDDKKWAMSGKRDPFFSPVVQQGGSGCSTGKKCLEIGNINLRGVVKSDTGFIAVVTNSLNKAYFLRENDPVFNGFVMRITGDSVVFQETVQDKLGKPFTREVVKRLFTPAV